MRTIVLFAALFAACASASVQAEIPVTLVGQWGGPCYAVAVSGNLAYVGEGPRLIVLDTTNPSNPTRLGKSDVLPDIVRGVAVSGNYAYVAAQSAGLLVIDISNPASPVPVGGYDSSGYAWGVAVSGNYAYVAAGWAGLQVIDISNPASPVLVGGYDTSGWAYGVAVSGNYAYVADGEGGLVILHIGIEGAVPVTIGEAKLLQNDTLVEITGVIVSAVWADRFYVENESRAGGIRVERACHGLLVGTRVEIVGTVQIDANGERYISAATLASVGTGSVSAVGMTCSSLGGGDFGSPSLGEGQRGVTGGTGPNNIGLLARIWGRVTEVDPSPARAWFDMDDGSGVNVRCDMPSGTLASDLWQYVAVTGISRLYKDGEVYKRRISIPSAQDITVIQ